MELPSSFFNRPVLDVAPDLLGKYLCISTKDGVVGALIHETEAYDGPDDKACHAHKGLTERTRPMFGPAGHAYVYLVYGMYWMLNVVTGPEGYPAAVLVRGAGEWDGPGKLTKALGVSKDFNQLPLRQSSGLWIEDRGLAVSRDRIHVTPRIGVDYAKEWKDKPFRFVLDSNYVQKLCSK